MIIKSIIAAGLADELSALEKEDNRPDQFKDVAFLSDFCEMGIQEFNDRFTIKKGGSGVMYIAGRGPAASEMEFLVQGFVARCLVVGPKVIER